MDPIMTVSYHASTGDKFSAEIEGSNCLAMYAVLKIRNGVDPAPITIFTPSGRNWTRDYLIEMRDELNAAVTKIDELEEAE